MGNTFSFPYNHLGAPSKYEKMVRAAITMGSDVIRLPTKMQALSCKQYLRRHGFNARQSKCLVQFSKEPFEIKEF